MCVKDGGNYARIIRGKGTPISQLNRVTKAVRQMAKFPVPLLHYRPMRARTVRRGTDYGGWWFRPEENLYGGVVISAGAGEDISFDVALAAEFGSTVHIVDPTPRAIRHVRTAIARAGLASEADFVAGGKQPPAAYDLSRVEASQLVLHEVALFNSECVLNFFPPNNPEHVSHTIDSRRNVGPKDEVLRVQAQRLSTLLSDGELDRIALLKLDIEGAEIEVIDDLVATGKRPNQILVEFDTLAMTDESAVERARGAFAGLRRAGYRLVNRERLNFSFSIRDK